METVEQTCPKHGPYTANVLSSGPVRVLGRCPKCFEEKRQSVEFHDLHAISAKTARERTEMAIHFQQACIPKRFQGRNFEGYDVRNEGQRRAKITAQRYAEDFHIARSDGACLCFTGDPGTGKTHLAAAIGNHVIAHGSTALFMTAYNAVGKIKDTWRPGSKLTEAQALKLFLAPDLLILDEVGAQHGSEAEKLMLFNIINGRYEEMLPTIVVSNLPLPHLVKVLGNRAVDRLKENGGAVVEFKWESFRR